MMVDLSHLKILLVDDSLHMRRIVRSLLNGLGIRDIDEADDGAVALQLFEESVPDIVISDWVMPVFDGLELTRAIRNADSANPYTSIIMMTGHTERSKVLQARDAGVTEFLVKPMSAKSLFARISNCLENPRPFVKTKSYFGPDRRRFVHPSYQGERKRRADVNLAEEIALDKQVENAI